jgi:hypothetical protein
METTERGFGIRRFVDRYGVSCSIQKSSLGTENCIWLGCDELGLKRLEPGRGWVDVKLPDEVAATANTRMHLTQQMARDLLPILQHFADTGELI